MSRPTVPAAMAALLLSMSAAVLLPAAPAAAGEAIFVESNPSTVPAGDEIGLRASCDDNLKPAVVSGEPIDSVAVNPRFGFLTATVRVPATTPTGDYPLLLRCPDGASATTTLHVVARSRPSRGPATGGGGTATGGAAPALIGGGLAVVAGGLLLGMLSLRRRRTG